MVENDEILEELRRCQSELKAVSAHNLGQLRRLLKVLESVLKNYTWIAQPLVVMTNRTLFLKVGHKFKIGLEISPQLSLSYLAPSAGGSEEVEGELRPYFKTYLRS